MAMEEKDGPGASTEVLYLRLHAEKNNVSPDSRPETGAIRKTSYPNWFVLIFVSGRKSPLRSMQVLRELISLCNA